MACRSCQERYRKRKEALEKRRALKSKTQNEGVPNTPSETSSEAPIPKAAGMEELPSSENSNGS